MDCVRRRGKVYCAVITVPADLRLLIGKSQIWRSLKTKNYSVARSQARKLLLTVDQLFLQIRNTVDSRLINAMVADFGLDLLKFNDEIRLGTLAAPSNYDADKTADIENIKTFYAEASKTANGRSILEESAKLMVDRIQERIFENRPDDLHFVSGAYEMFLNKHGVDLPLPESNDAKELMSAFAQTAKLAYLIEKERVRGVRDESDLQHRIITKWQADRPVRKDVGMPLSELLEQYFDVWQKEYRKKPNLNEYRIRRKLKDLEIIKHSMFDYFGKDIGIKEIDYDKAINWRDFHQADNEIINSSMNKYTEQLSSVWGWAIEVQRKYAEFNPFKKARLPEGVKRDKTREFSDVELQQYVHILSNTYQPDCPEKIWIPLIIMYSGMRNNEIAQLYVDDIQERDGISFFRITGDNLRNQRVKAESSQRDLPIHSKLIELGFIDYVQSVKSSGQAQLFPNCVYIERTGRYYDDNLSSRLNELVDCITDDRKLRVYSLRANFKTAIDSKFADAAIDVMEGKTSSLDLGGFEKFINRAFDDVMGHSTKGTSGDTIYRKVQLRLMGRIVEQAEYSVDISKLKKVILSSTM